MYFRDFIVPEAILGDLVSTSGPEALSEMVDALVRAGSLSEEIRQGVLTALIDREAVGSTGIGQGIAIPHAKHPAVRKLVGLVARSREGVQFDSLDGEPVHLFFLILSNQAAAGEHLKALAYISRHLRNEIFHRFLLRARDEREIRKLLEQADEQGVSDA
jgi:mannitol/fructose-specific phosphotransferase system IIA component (Ntr-type)